MQPQSRLRNPAVVPVVRVLIAAAITAAAGCSSTTGPSEVAHGPRTYVVDPSGAGDFVRIQEALNAVADGDTVLLLPGAYSGPGNKNLTIIGVSPVIMGLGDRDITVIDCDESGRGFYIGSGAAPVIENLTITNGDTLRGGGMYLESASPSLRNVRFRYNRTSEQGGEGAGIYCRNGSPALSDVLFDHNYADGSGGGMQCVGTLGTPALNDVVFYDNTAQGSGGGMSCFFSAPALSGCVFWKNASAFGAGIYCNTASPAVTNCTFAENEGQLGGGIFMEGNSSPTILNSIIAFSTYGQPMECEGGSTPFTTRCCIYGNVGGNALCGDYSTSMLRVDPLFCDVLLGDLTLRADSPCLPENNPWGVLIGAYGQGCDFLEAVAGHPSWGTIKSLFR
ncbi:MAG: right-handed parallel beta-helix repeat-containing protein [Candidatus Eisenbacteria bacterium]|nr:right-handed parallel beta-helix repeat-containing protein [Candidatus Eisenbacteria bacterium]